MADRIMEGRETCHWNRSPPLTSQWSWCGPVGMPEDGARCRVRTCDPFRVKEVLYR